jgi:hypothetical protein
MDQALLLSAWDAIVAGVEVGDEDALVSGQYLADDVCLSRLRHAEDDVPAVGEHPNVVVHAFNETLGVAAKIGDTTIRIFAII